MTDEEIKAYVDDAISKLKTRSIDLANLDVIKPTTGSALPFVADKKLKSALVDDLKGSSGGAIKIDWYEGN